jgi:predicted metal-binding membrane protein
MVAIDRERALVLAALIGIALAAWTYTAYLAWDMPAVDRTTIALPRFEGWSAVEFLLMFLMWVIMMVAMMLPSAAPVLLLYAKAVRGKSNAPDALARSSLFAIGYAGAWAGFSLFATLAQWALHALALLSPQMVSTSAKLGGGLLIVAGVFQWTPLKHACLSKCRSPLGFFMSEWRDGARGAFVMGLRHGMYCVGCCWALMVLLFVTGVMNLLWIAALAIFVLLEKVAPAGHWVARISGILLVAAGVWLLVQ